MEKRFYVLCAFVCIVFDNVCAAADQQTLFVQIAMKYTAKLSFSSTTTILHIKQRIQDHEGILVERQRLCKKEWIRSGSAIPEETYIDLDDDKTCASYDFKPGAKIYCWLRARRASY